MESSTRTSKQKAVKKAIANVYDNMAVEEFGLPGKRVDGKPDRKDMEELCPETTFTRNLTSFPGKKALITIIAVLSLITLALATVNILLLTRGNLQCDCQPCEGISTSQMNGYGTGGMMKTKDGATGGIMRTNDGATGGIKRNTSECYIAVTDCSDAPCQNGATCNGEITCDCLPGYEGDLCDTNIDECVGEPCLNGGTCVDGVDDFTCDCMPGYEGALCEAVPYLVMLGGSDTNENAYSACDVYELSGSRSDAFTVPPLPQPRSWAAVVNTEISLYVIGGYQYRLGTMVDTMYHLNKTTLIWEELSPMHNVRRYHAAVEINDKIVVVGGRSTSGDIATVEIYDVASNSWRELGPESDYPMNIHSHALCVWRGKVYASGGGDYADWQAGVYTFSIDTERWTWFADLLQERDDHSMVVVDDRLYVLDGTNTNTIEMYDESINAFTVIANSSISMVHTNAVVLDSKIITAGGTENENLVTFDTVSREINITNMDLRRDYHQTHVAIMTFDGEAMQQNITHP